MLLAALLATAGCTHGITDTETADDSSLLKATGGIQMCAFIAGYA